MVTGMPSATPDAEPNDVVRSLRTTPDSVSTFTPFDPSPGYGPAVSSGISPSATATDDPAPPGPPEGGVGWDVTISVPPLAQPTPTGAIPAAPKSPSRPRLPRILGRSWERPRSC